MRTADAVRLAVALGAVEMSLVRRDAVTGPLLAQAARAAEGSAVGPWLAYAARMTRDAGFWDDVPAGAARRKVAQALCRAAAQYVQAELLARGADAPGER